MEDRLLYRVREVAVIFNISRSKVYELFSSGDLESVKIDQSSGAELGSTRLC